MKRVAAALWIAALAVVLVAGCRKHHRRHGHGGDDRGWPEAVWPAPQVTVNEGATFTVVLALDRAWEQPVDVDLSSTDPGRVVIPASVTFPAGVTTRNVTIRTIADADSGSTIVQVFAETTLDVNAMGIVLRETQAPLGGALGPVAAGAGRALLVTDGPDGIWSTADDTLAVAGGVGGGIPVLTHVTIGAVTPGPQAWPVVTGVADTVLVLTNGPDLTLGTTDDTLVEVGGVSGGSPAVTATLGVGRMEASEGRRPVMFGTRAAWVTRGADLVTSADDQFVVLDGIGTGTLSVSSNPIPGVTFEGPCILSPIDSSSAGIALAGPDFVPGTADDIAGVITGIGGSLSGITLGTFPQAPGRMGIPVRVGPTTVATAWVGGDLILGTPDDGVVVWQDIFAVPVPLVFPTGALPVDPEAQPAATGGDSLLLPLRGPDLADSTADDQVALLTALSTPVPPAPVLLASASPFAGAAGRIVTVSTTGAVRNSAGADGLAGTSDDGVVVLTDLTGSGATSTLPTGALQPFAPLPRAADSVAVAGEGADGVSGTADDAVMFVSGIGGAVAVTELRPGPFRLSGAGAIVTDGSASHVLARTAGADGAGGTADDPLSTATLP